MAAAHRGSAWRRGGAAKALHQRRRWRKKQRREGGTK